jgi:proteasomal ATPase-associated factor 1
MTDGAIQVILTASSDLSIRIFGAKDGINPRILRGHTRAITCLHILGIGKQVLSGSKDGTVRLWDVGSGKEVGKWDMEGRKGVEGMVVVDDERGLRELGLSDGQKGVIVASREGLSVWVAEGGKGRLAKVVETGEEAGLVCVGYGPELGVLVTGHTNGVIVIHPLSSFCPTKESSALPTRLRRNESPIYTLVLDGKDLLVGTASGLPCRLALEQVGEGWRARTKIEYAGWEAVGVECIAIGKDGIWAGGGEGGLRRY